MNKMPKKGKVNWSELLGLNPDERMVEIQDIAARRAYIVFMIQMILLGGYLYSQDGQVIAILAPVAVLLSIIYLLWQHHRLGSGGPLDERARLTFNHQFRYMNVALSLVCLLIAYIQGSALWVMLFFFPALVILGTLLMRRVYTGRAWLLWLLIGLVFGGIVGFWRVIDHLSPVVGWLIVVITALLSGWLAIKTYRRPRSM
jgi:hypothetical protein